MAIYRYQKISEHTILALKGDSIRFSQLANLNDPYEVWCNFSTKLPNPKNQSELIEFLIAKKEFSNFSEGKKFIDNLDQNRLSEYIKHLESKLTQRFEKIRAESENNVTLCCFSKTSDIFLMWAHYGDGLKGICIEYDESIMTIDGHDVSKIIYDVTYPEADDVPTVDVCRFIMDGGNKELFNAMFATKSIQWEYEQERRIIHEFKDPRPKGHDISRNVAINKESIKSITFGEKANPHWIEIIKNIFKNSDVAFKLASRNKNKYKIDIS